MIPAFLSTDTYEILFLIMALVLMAGVPTASFIFFFKYKKIKDELSKVSRQRNELLKQLIEQRPA